MKHKTCSTHPASSVLSLSMLLAMTDAASMSDQKCEDKHTACLRINEKASIISQLPELKSSSARSLRYSSVSLSGSAHARSAALM
eukprot:1320105-Pleurochrysis_carterae.AAC.1